MVTDASPRGVHFVGSIKMPDGRPDAEGAMRAALDSVVGLPLYSLSDGETGPREWWVRPYIDGQSANPNLVLARDGGYSSYRDVPEYAVRPGRTLTPQSLGLRYAEPVSEAWRILSRLRVDYDRPDLALQVGVASPVDLAVFSMGFAGGAAHIGTYADAVGVQIATIVDTLGRDVVIQLETPAALSLALAGDDNLPPDLQTSTVVAWLARVAGYAPAGARFGLHWCLGDMNNRTQNDQPLTDGEPVSRLVGEVLAAWPQGRDLEYVHFPVAGGKRPALLDPGIYQGLRGLRDVPATTRIIAGVAHEAGTLAEQLRALELVDDAAGRRVDVAAACGIARGRTVPASRLVMRRTADLAAAGADAPRPRDGQPAAAWA